MNKVTVRSYLITLLSLTAFVFTSYKADKKNVNQTSPDISNNPNIEQSQLLANSDLSIKAALEYARINETPQALELFLPTIESSSEVKEQDVFAHHLSQSNKSAIEALDSSLQRQPTITNYLPSQYDLILSKENIALITTEHYPSPK